MEKKITDNHLSLIFDSIKNNIEGMYINKRWVRTLQVTKVGIDNV